MLGSAALLMFILLVAAANLCLGFAAAAYLGVGPQSWPPKFFEKRQEDAPIIDDVAPSLSAPVQPVATVEPQLTEIASDEAESASHPLATVLEQLARGFDRLEAELADWDSRRRAETIDADSLANAVIELNGLASGYLEQFESSLLPLKSLPLCDTGTNAAHDEFDACTRELSQQLATVCAELGSLQFEEGDTDAAAEKLTTGLIQLLAALHASRNRLEEPLVAMLGVEVHDAALVAILKEHVDTCILGRLSFEHTWQAGEGYRLSGEIGSVALLDVDTLRQLNASHGALVSRKVLRAVGEIAREYVEPGVSVARLIGKQFVLSLPDQSPQATAQLIERIRQQIEQTHLEVESGEVRVTVSAAVVSVGENDSTGDVLQRLRSTIREAKSYGRNRTFLWEDKAPTPVMPPKLAIEERTVKL